MVPSTLLSLILFCLCCRAVVVTPELQPPNRRWHFRRIFSAERMLQMQGLASACVVFRRTESMSFSISLPLLASSDLSCAPPILPDKPVEALLWVLETESGCDLRVFESVPGKPTMQVYDANRRDQHFLFFRFCMFATALITINSGLDRAKACRNLRDSWINCSASLVLPRNLSHAILRSLTRTPGNSSTTRRTLATPRWKD